MTPEGILLVGAGGHAMSCIDVIEAQGRFCIQGLLGSPAEKGGQRLGYPVLGSDEDLSALLLPGGNALVCVGQIKTPEPRMRLFGRLRELGYALPAIVAPTAWVSPHARIGAGSIVMHGAIVNAGAEVGENCIINTRALVEHGARVGNHCHVSTGALLNGDVEVGAGSFIGSGSQVKDGVRVGQRCIVGFGATVFGNLADGATLKQAG
jgi:sugar O-acyltransferase (sialic acid O-acetyltransferase NeuD family)